jgi:hypothetical protein
MKFFLRLPMNTTGFKRGQDQKEEGFRKGVGQRMTRIKCRMRLRAAAGILFLMGMLCPSAPVAEEIGEGDVKAAFVLNFMKFVEWPASAFQSPEDPIVLSVLGNDPRYRGGGWSSGRFRACRRWSGAMFSSSALPRRRRWPRSLPPFSDGPP